MHVPLQPTDYHVLAVNCFQGIWKPAPTSRGTKSTIASAIDEELITVSSTNEKRNADAEAC